jgi:hypothetical protein
MLEKYQFEDLWVVLKFKRYFVPSEAGSIASISPRRGKKEGTKD